MKTAETEINNRSYKILFPPVRKRMAMANHLTVQIGGVAAALGSNMSLENFGSIFQKLDPDKILSLMTSAASASNLTCDGKPCGRENDFDRHFEQCPEDVYQVCFWAIWECTKDFLPRSLAGSIQEAQEKFKEEFQSRMAGK